MGLSNYIPASSIARPGVCTSTTRPASPYEGQTIYETDTDMLAIWNGSAWRYIAATTPTNGTVLQVINTTYSVLAINNTNTYADTGLTATITPKSSSSKILVCVNQASCQKLPGNAGSHFDLRLYRGTTQIAIIDYSAGYTNTTGEIAIGTLAGSYLDSPATASAVTYKTQFRNQVNTSGVAVQVNAANSSMVLMEISA